MIQISSILILSFNELRDCSLIITFTKYGEHNFMLGFVVNSTLILPTYTHDSNPTKT